MFRHRLVLLGFNRILFHFVNFKCSLEYRDKLCGLKSEQQQVENVVFIPLSIAGNYIMHNCKTHYFFCDREIFLKFNFNMHL